MFNRSADKRARKLAEMLLLRLERRWSPDLLTDANYHLRFGQFDGVVSNVAAVVYEGREQFDRIDDTLFERLVALLRMRGELAELKKYIAEHPKRPEGPAHKLWA